MPSFLPGQEDPLADAPNVVRLGPVDYQRYEQRLALREPQKPEESEVVWENLSSFKRISRAFTRGRTTVERGVLGEQIRQQGEGITPEFRDDVNRLTDRINELGGNGPGFVGWVSAAAETVGTMAESIITPTKQASEAFTNPDPNLSSIQQVTEAVDRVGEAVVLPIGAWKTFFAAEGGNTNIDLLEAGVDPQIAGTAAVAVGAINASLEMVGLAGATKPLTVATKKLLQTGIKTAIKNPKVMRWAGRAALAWGKSIGAEVSTEVLQEVTTIAAEEVAKNLSDIEGQTPEQIQERLATVAIQTFKSMVILGSPGAVTEFAASVKETKVAENRKQASVELKKILDEAPDPVQAHDQVAAELDLAGVKEVFISADALVDAAEASGNKGTYYAALGVGNQIQEAALLGGDVRITASKFVDLLQSDQFQALADHIRYDRDGMTIEETKNQDRLADRVEALTGEMEEAEVSAVEGETLAPETVKSQGDLFVELDEELFGLQAFFTNAKDAGMTDIEYKTYLGVLAKSNEARGKKMEGLRLRKQLRDNTAEMKARRAELEETAREAINQQPVYAALNAIGRERLNRERLAELIGESNLEKLPRVNGRQIYEKGGSVDPEVFAEAYGFEGTDIMAYAMIDNPPKAQAVKDMTEQLFNERYIGLSIREELIEMQIEALHTDESAAILALELNKLREAQGLKKVRPRELKLAARQRLRDYKLKAVNPKKFLAAERREANNARRALRKGDRKAATQAKFRQLLNFQFAQEAYAVRERTKNQHKYFRKFLKRPKRGAALPIDYFLGIQTMLGDTAFKKPSLETFIHQVMQNDGVMLEIPLQMRQANGKKHYLDLTLGEWEELYDHVKYVEKTGLDANRLLREEEKKSREEIAASTAENVRANLKQKDPETETSWQKSKSFGRGLRAVLFDTNAIVREADGFKSLGAVYSAIKRPYDWAISRGYSPGQIGYVAREVKEAKRFKELYSIYTKSEQVNMKKRLTIAGVSRRMSHQRVIMVLLNSGNVGNRRALLDSGWTEKELDLVIASASEKDVKFAQGIWDYFEEFWPEVLDSAKRRRNLAPSKVEARSVETPYGVLRGGYFPLVYKDKGATILSNASVTDIDKLQSDMRIGTFIHGMTRHGHTEERRGSAGKEVNLEIYDIQRHIQHVIYDLEVGDATIDILKILNHRDVKKAFTEMGHEAKWEQLMSWFMDIRMGEMHTGEAWEVGARYMKTGFVVSRIAFNVGTIIQQPLGLLQTAAQIGKYNTLHGIMTLMFNPRSGRFIRGLSPVMEHRQATYNRDIEDARRSLGTGVLRRMTPGESAEFAGKMAFWGLAKFQAFVDLATWLGAKRQGMRMFDGNEAKSNEHADLMVIRAQGSGIFGERTPLERGTLGKMVRQSDVIRAMVPLMSYFMAKNNVAFERIRSTNKKNPLALMNMSIDLFLMYAVEAWLSALIVGAWPDDEDDVAGWAMWTAAKSVATGIPVVNWAVSGAEGFQGGGALPAVAQDWSRLIVQLSQGEWDAPAVKAAVRVGGDMMRLPGTSQAIRIGEGVVRAADGEDVNAMEMIFGSRWRD